jgi:hypothetical protein
VAKYRKKPIVVEAEQFRIGKHPYPEGVFFEGDGHGNSSYIISTLEGELDVLNGDWIITGVKGEKYPCKPDIFEMTYELVLDG